MTSLLIDNRHGKRIVFAIAGVACALISFSTFVTITNAADERIIFSNRKFHGITTEINREKLETFGTDAKGIEKWPKFRITERTIIQNGVLLFDAPDDVRRNVTNEIRRGTVVTVWATSSGEALIIRNMAPRGQGDFYGPVDCPSCGR